MQIKARGLALIGVLLSLAEGEGHYLDCEGSCEGIAVETGKAGIAKLQATVNSGRGNTGIQHLSATQITTVKQRRRSGKQEKVKK